MPRILIVEDEPAISFGLELDLKTDDTKPKSSKTAKRRFAAHATAHSI
jgi:hypothetical protein